jgi:PAS domain S-box-containing protein
MNDTTNSAIRILLADDDVGQAEMLREFLRISGFENIDHVENVRSMWQQIEQHTYDVILLDYMLPDGTGLDVLAQMRDGESYAPVVMVTGQGSERIAALAIQAGAADYVIKTGDYLMSIPALLLKTIKSHQLKQSMKRSLDQIRYQALLLNNVRDAVVVWDTTGRITYWNPSASDLFGWQAEESIGQMAETAYLSLFTPSITLPGAQEKGVALHSHQYETRRLQTKDNRTIWVSSKVTALYDPGMSNHLIGYMDVSHDISKRKDMEAQIEAAQRQLVQAARLATIGEMAAGFAHQINNPLTTIIADAQLLLRSLSPDQPGRESAEAIEQAGWRMQQVVQRFMEFSRPGSGPSAEDAAAQIFLVNETIQHAVALVSGQIEEIGCKLEIRLSQPSALVSGNARQLQNLWIYLLLLGRDAVRLAAQENLAEQYAGLIQIESYLTKDGIVVIEVCDNGKPVPDDQLASIFEPDFVGSHSGRGAGMELSLCREIVYQHGGVITADCSPARREAEQYDGEIGAQSGAVHPKSLDTVCDTIFRVALPAKTVTQDEAQI